MELYGKVITTNAKDRIIKLQCSDRICFFHMTRRQLKDYGTYFYRNPYVFIVADATKKKYGNQLCYEVGYFRKIIKGTRTHKETYFNIDVIRQGLKQLIGNTKNKLFLDLEFSLPSYYQTMMHIPEILQYGVVVEDENNNIVFQEGSLVKPLRKFAINNRTLKFLSKTNEQFEEAKSYIEFYQLLEKLIKDYDPKVIAWGKNDILTMEQSFRLNHLKPLEVRSRYINLMQVIKNYYNTNTDLGLFSTYQEMSKEVVEQQQHDAMEDALMARNIYHLFTKIIDKEVKTKRD
ncbi:MAG: exonuclease domain-containing protein [Bacilli bacterium]